MELVHEREQLSYHVQLGIGFVPGLFPQRAFGSPRSTDPTPEGERALLKVQRKALAQVLGELRGRLKQPDKEVVGLHEQGTLHPATSSHA